MRVKTFLKSALLLTVFMAVLLSLGGCKANATIPNEIELSLKGNTLTPTSMTLVINNNSNAYDFVYGADYGIEIYTNDEWSEVTPLKEHVVFTIAYTIHPNSSKEFEIDWQWLYGELPKGNYRIVKNFDKVAAYDDISNVITNQNLYYYFAIE